MPSIITTDDQTQEDPTELGALAYTLRSSQSQADQIAEIPKYLGPLAEAYLDCYEKQIEQARSTEPPTHEGRTLGPLSRREIYD